jgi:hypothetical protein
VLVVVDVSDVVAVDGLAGTGLAVTDVVGSAGGTAAGSSVPPPPPQAQPAKTRTTPRARRRRRMVANVSPDRHRHPPADPGNCDAWWSYFGMMDSEG